MSGAAMRARAKAAHDRLDHQAGAGAGHPADLAPLIFGHPAPLFVLFFTEMWERFSYYGMRSLLVLFLIADLKHGGWGWSRAEALQLYGWYTGLVFFTPLIGGYIADRWLGCS